jgi:hypothetical protein
VGAGRFLPVSTQRDGSGGPAIRAAARSRRRDPVEPIRFVNQFESGTSSMVLMFCAACPTACSPRDEQVGRHFVHRPDVIGLRLRRVLGLRLPRDRIVRVEVRTLRRDAPANSASAPSTRIRRLARRAGEANDDVDMAGSLRISGESRR